MDWSRAKTLLILAFLMLNGLLGYQLWTDELNLDTFSINAERREEMNRLLSLKEAAIESAVPEGTPPLSEITVRFREGADGGETNELPKPLPDHAPDDIYTVVEALRPSIPDIDSFQHDPYALKSDDTHLVMNQLYGNLPMFEMRLELVGTEEVITSYRLAMSEVQTSTEPPAGQEILSAYVVIGNLAETYLPRRAVISDVRLGYHGPIFESETQVLAPYWRITLRSGEIYYVHAIHGAVEGPTALDNPADLDDSIIDQE